VQERITAQQWRMEPQKQRRPYRDLEHREQVALMAWIDANKRKYPELEMAFAIPNGGKRSKAVAGKLKAEGVKSGIPDICILAPRGGLHGLLVELKTSTGRPTPLQLEWIDRLNRYGYRAVVAKGWEAARDEIVGYLAMGE
jgi:VRR-NUC domain-containing protein